MHPSLNNNEVPARSSEEYQSKENFLSPPHTHNTLINFTNLSMQTKKMLALRFWRNQFHPEAVFSFARNHTTKG